MARILRKEITETRRKCVDKIAPESHEIRRSLCSCSKHSVYYDREILFCHRPFYRVS